MKKVICFMLVALTFVLSGCGNKPHCNNNIEVNLQYIHSEYFDVEVIEDLGGGSFVIVDKNTNVLYLFVKGYRASAMTPIYNSNGTVVLYQDCSTEKDGEADA